MHLASLSSVALSKASIKLVGLLLKPLLPCRVVDENRDLLRLPNCLVEEHHHEK